MQVSESEIAELDEGAARGRERSSDLRARLAETPIAPRAGAFVAETVARHSDAPPPEEALVRAAKSGDPQAREASRLAR